MQAERISDAVMECKWERLPVRLRRQLLMVMMRAQRPLRLTAAGFTHMDNACFLAVSLHLFYILYKEIRHVKENKIKVPTSRIL